jgi:hypothetical protein
MCVLAFLRFPDKNKIKKLKHGKENHIHTKVTFTTTQKYYCVLYGIIFIRSNLRKLSLE